MVLLPRANLIGFTATEEFETTNKHQIHECNKPINEYYGQTKKEEKKEQNTSFTGVTSAATPWVANRNNIKIPITMIKCTTKDTVIVPKQIMKEHHQRITKTCREVF